MLKPLNRQTAGRPQQYPVRVLQFGKGNFLRGFADWMIDILNEKTGFNSAVTVVQVFDRGAGGKLEEQEGLYHVVLNGIHQGKPVRQTRLITCIHSVINPFLSYGEYLEAGENPDLAFIISNTTEAGIVFSEADQVPDVPATTFPGKLTALLYHRYKTFGGDPEKALTIFPCELIENNGETLRSIVLRYAGHWNLEEGFRKWIAEDTLFCNTLVDRIVPGYPKESIDEISAATGYNDGLVVTGEIFHLWVIEPGTDDPQRIARLREAFPAERAGLHVKFVSDLTPYRSQKVRILNGAHTVMVPVGYLRGLRTVREAIDDPFTGEFVRAAIDEEIIPTLDLPPDELRQFAADVIERFQNPFIRHELTSIALNSVSKYKVRVLPSALEFVHRTGRLPDRLLYALAALILFYRGHVRGAAIPLNDTDKVLDYFAAVWKGEDPSAVVPAVLSNTELWGIDLTQIAGLKEVVEKHLRVLMEIS